MFFISFIYFIFKGDALKQNNVIVISEKNTQTGELLMYRSATSFTDSSGVTIKKMMYSHKAQSKCRINWDVLSFPNKAVGTHLRLHFNFDLKDCTLTAEEISAISNLMLKKVFKEWNIKEIGDVQVDLPNVLSSDSKSLKLLGQKFIFSRGQENTVFFTKEVH